MGVTGPGGELSVISLAAFALIAGALAACLPVRDAAALPVTVLASTAAAVTTALLWGELTLLFAGAVGVTAGALLASFRRFLVLQGVPAGLLPKLAVGAAPIAVMGGTRVLHRTPPPCVRR